MRKIIAMVFVGCLLTTTVKAVDYYTCGTGDWAGAICGTSISCTNPGVTLPALVNGDRIFIDNNITINTNVDISNRNVTIRLSAVITIEAQLRLSDASTIVFESSAAKIIPTSGGNNDKIRFGNNFVWDGADGTLTGPGTMDKNFNPGTSPLPVTIIFFDAAVNQKSIELNWATATELNSSYFSIEKSTDGLTFSELSQVAAAGNSVSRIDYAHSDKNPIIGGSYYRLREFDIDGSSEYFNTVYVNYNGEKGIHISPNPYNSGELTFKLNFANNENSYAVITDLSGKQVSNFNFAGTSFKTSSLKLHAGTYLVKIKSEGRQYVSRLVVE